jgi:hypothetical protein
MWNNFKLIAFIVGLMLSCYNLIDFWRKNKRLEYKNALLFVLFVSLLISEL